MEHYPAQLAALKRKLPRGVAMKATGSFFLSRDTGNMVVATQGGKQTRSRLIRRISDKAHWRKLVRPPYKSSIELQDDSSQSHCTPCMSRLLHRNH